MSRHTRLEIPNGWYHVIDRGHSAKGDFSGSGSKIFCSDWGQFPERFGVRIYTYVLMPNHYHLQLELGSRLSLSAAMHWLNTGYGIWFNRRYRRHLLPIDFGHR